MTRGMHLQFPSASMGIRAGLSHAQEVMVFLPDSTCRQELDLKPIRCNWFPASEWLLESRVLPGNAWERAWHSDPGKMSIRVSMFSFPRQVSSVLGCGGDCWQGASVGTQRRSSFH